MNARNPQNLNVGDIIEPTGPGWYDNMRGKTYAITSVDPNGDARFVTPDDVHQDGWIADEGGSPQWAVRVVARAMPAARTATATTPDAWSPQPPVDAINPAHYRLGNGMEAIDVMEAFDLTRDGRLFNAGKYILRAGKKDLESQDIRKAIWYLERYATALEARGE